MGVSVSAESITSRLLLVLYVWFALASAGVAFDIQAASTIPANPTSNDEVIVVVKIVDSCEMALKDPNNRIQIVGFTINYVYASPCVTGVLGTLTYTNLIEIQLPVGKLQAGTYAIVAREKPYDVNSVWVGESNQFVVSASDVNTPNPNAIPATHPLTIMMLGGLLVRIVHLRLLR
jgi:hypothetical protein